MKRMRIRYRGTYEVIEDVKELSDSDLRRYSAICRQGIKSIDRRIDVEDARAEKGLKWLGDEWREKALASRMAYEENVKLLELEAQDRFGFTISRAERFYEVAEELLGQEIFREIEMAVDRLEGIA